MLNAGTLTIVGILIFFDSTKLKSVWKKIKTFFKRHFLIDEIYEREMQKKIKTKKQKKQKTTKTEKKKKGEGGGGGGQKLY